MHTCFAGQVDLTSGMSIEASRQIEELQRRIHVLEKQNTALATKARTLQDHSTSMDFGALGAWGGGGRQQRARVQAGP